MGRGCANQPGGGRNEEGRQPHTAQRVRRALRASLATFDQSATSFTRGRRPPHRNTEEGVRKLQKNWSVACMNCCSVCSSVSHESRSAAKSDVNASTAPSDAHLDRRIRRLAEDLEMVGAPRPPVHFDAPPRATREHGHPTAWL